MASAAASSAMPAISIRLTAGEQRTQRPVAVYRRQQHHAGRAEDDGDRGGDSQRIAEEQQTEHGNLYAASARLPRRA